MLRRTIAFASGVLCILLTASPGYAQATWYVTATGTGNCLATAPCAQLGTALAFASPGDTIVCLSPPQPGAFVIIRAVTIDCSQAHAPFQGGSFKAVADGSHVSISINVQDGDVVRLRGLTITGPAIDRGIDIERAGAVYIEDCLISNYLKQGIYDHRTGGHSGLFIKDSVISGNPGAGIVAASAAVSGTVLDNVTLENNGFGIAVAKGNNVAIRNSVFSGNSNAGIEGDSGSQITVYNSKISHNNIGVQSQSSVRVSNNDIEFNSTAFNGPAATMGSNRFSGNGSMGTPLMPISGAPADIGP